MKVAIGSRVVIRAAGDFNGYVGTVSRITQHGKRSRPYIWIVFDAHPWQKPGIDWAFTVQEIRLRESAGSTPTPSNRQAHTYQERI